MDPAPAKYHQHPLYLQNRAILPLVLSKCREKGSENIHVHWGKYSFKTKTFVFLASLYHGGAVNVIDDSVLTLTHGVEYSQNSRFRTAEHVNLHIQIYRRNNITMTTIHEAAERGDLEAIRRFIEVDGVDVDCRDDFGRTPLVCVTFHCSDRSRMQPVVLYLISKNANVEAKGEKGHTVLMAASFYGHAEIAKILLEGGADVNFGTDAQL